MNAVKVVLLSLSILLPLCGLWRVWFFCAYVTTMMLGFDERS